MREILVNLNKSTQQFSELRFLKWSKPPGKRQGEFGMVMSEK